MCVCVFRQVICPTIFDHIHVCSSTVTFYHVGIKSTYNTPQHMYMYKYMHNVLMKT